VATPFVIQRIQPGDNGSRTVRVLNYKSNLDALVTASIRNVTSTENVCREPETADGDNCADVSASNGELANELLISITVPDNTLDAVPDVDGNAATTGHQNDDGGEDDVLLAPAALSTLGNYTAGVSQLIAGVELATAENSNILEYTVLWSLPDTQADQSNMMTDVATFELKFDAVDSNTAETTATDETSVAPPVD
jgi:hypothetical protein